MWYLTGRYFYFCVLPALTPTMYAKKGVEFVPFKCVMSKSTLCNKNMNTAYSRLLFKCSANKTCSRKELNIFCELIQDIWLNVERK